MFHTSNLTYTYTGIRYYNKAQHIAYNVFYMTNMTCNELMILIIPMTICIQIALLLYIYTCMVMSYILNILYLDYLQTEQHQ